MINVDQEQQNLPEPVNVKGKHWRTNLLFYYTPNTTVHIIYIDIAFFDIAD